MLFLLYKWINFKSLLTEESFTDYIDSFFIRFPQLKKRVTFTGCIYDRKELYKEYSKAKIFCLTSRWEGFAVVLAEAMHYGCYIISSELDGVKERLDGDRFGSFYPKENVSLLACELKKIVLNPSRMEHVCNITQKYSKDNFFWPFICKKIDQYLN